MLCWGVGLFVVSVGITPTGGDLLHVSGKALAVASEPADEPSTSTTETSTSTTETSTTSTTVAPAPAPLVVPTSPDQWFQPSGRNQGTEGVVAFLTSLALRDNAPLYISEGWGRTTGASTSDHHISRTDSWAADVAVRGIQVPTATTETAARRIGSALGQPNWTGGDLTVTVDGYRIQALWKVAGHFNHVHVGVRKV